jgi:hypothetical protein
VAALLLSLTVAACGGLGQPPAGAHPDSSVVAVRLDLAATPISVPRGDYSGIAWVTEDAIDVGFDPGSDQPPNDIWQLSPNGGQLKKIALPADPSCRLLWYKGSHRRPDGTLGLVRECQPIVGSEIGNTVWQRSLVSVNRATGAMREIRGVVLSPDSVSWMPDGRSGAFSTGDDICESIVVMEPTTQHLVNLSVGDGARRFSLDADSAPGSNDCTNTGRADYPAYSPTGDRLAFLASPASIGVSGQARLDAPWGLYLTSGAGVPHEVMGDIVNPPGLAWTTNGRWLIFSGGVGDQGVATWAVEAATGRLVRLSVQGLDSLDVSPDGTRLVGVTTTASTTWPPLGDIVVINLAPLDSIGS